MEKQKRWQFFLIVSVFVLTLYNILPTLIYYSQPLKESVSKKEGMRAAHSIVQRVNQLESESKDWLVSFSQGIGAPLESIEKEQEFPHLFKLTFKTLDQAERFKVWLPKASSMIPFTPMQMNVAFANPLDQKEIYVEKKNRIHISEDEVENFFQYSSHFLEDGSIAPLYRKITEDRIEQLALRITGQSPYARILENHFNQTIPEEELLFLADSINSINLLFQDNTAIKKRFYNYYTQTNREDRRALATFFEKELKRFQTVITQQKSALEKELKAVSEKEIVLDPKKENALKLRTKQLEVVEKALVAFDKNREEFFSSPAAMTKEMIRNSLRESSKNIDPKTKQEAFYTGLYHPIIDQVVVDWSDHKLFLVFHKDLESIVNRTANKEEEIFQLEKINDLLINEIGRLSRLTSEKISPIDQEYQIDLNTLANSQSFLALDLSRVATQYGSLMQKSLEALWDPTHPDLTRENYPIIDYDTYRSLPMQQQKLGLVVYTPFSNDAYVPKGFDTGKIYVIVKGFNHIFEKYQEFSESEEAKTLIADFQSLAKLMNQQGFIGYPAEDMMGREFEEDFIFELNDYYSHFIKSSRESFEIAGSNLYAILPFTDLEQRILTQNRIEDAMHEDLLKWQEEYQKAQVSLDPTEKLLIPQPSKSIYFENLRLSLKKYFRGDDRKVLRWGLDLSGGKSVTIGLKDQNGRAVQDPESLNQAVNELYTRINKMGVAERTIRIENDHVVLDFPGSQGLSANELIKASSMTFHIVNEKFSLKNPELASDVNTFLQEVWNEAQISNQTDLNSINEIASRKLGDYQNRSNDEEFNFLSDSAKTLHQNGLKIASKTERIKSNEFNDVTSMIARFRGEDFSEWRGQSHPLLIVFQNYALEGASLENVQVGYDSTQGNLLAFGVKNSYDGQRAGSPREDFYAWTSQFSEDRISGTIKEIPSRGRGWRMAVILNGYIVNAPELKAALSNGGTISGNFTQREINQLAADLKAGSLTFTPEILSEVNISPELGLKERSQGINAAIIGLISVCVIMSFYYRFAGLIASVAVLFNLLIMWGVLQNLDAALSLPSIAGIVLTVGMAVDANVLVFERFREEFKISKRLGSAIQKGYQKAFSAIVDSNLTTIFAAIILIQFDAGPIKGFATTLIIGIVSSMFTALFMTRFFFASWLQRTDKQSLKMMSFIEETKINFLKMVKPVTAVTLSLMVIGSYLLFEERSTILGMDFTGGYSIKVNLEEGLDTSYRDQATQALVSAGADVTDFQVQELTRDNQLKLQFATAMNEENHPFYQMAEEIVLDEYDYAYQKNPRLEWVVMALEKGGLKIQQRDLENLDKNWSVMSGQFSDAMRSNALMALLVLY